MRLPEPSELLGEEEHDLRDHDVLELHGDTSSAQSSTYRRRIDLLVELIERHAPVGPVVDAACAQGNVAILMAERGRHAIGVDLRPAFLTYARRKDSDGLTDWVAGSLEALPLRPKSFACVVLGEVVEHVAYPERLLAQAAGVVRPGGLVIASTPNGDRLHTGLPNLADVSNRTELESRQYQPDANGHLFLLTRSELVLAGTAAGLELLEHRFIQTPVLTGWPKMSRLVERFPIRLREVLNARAERSGWSRLVADGQVAVFRSVAPLRQSS